MKQSWKLKQDFNVINNIRPSMIYVTSFVLLLMGCTFAKPSAPLQADIGVFQVLIYGALKFLSYATYCGFGIYYLKGRLHCSTSRAIELGFYRLLIGFAFGTLVYFASMYQLIDSHWTDIVMIRGPVRFIEWSIIAWLLKIKLSNIKVLMWIFMGVLLSFATDFLAIPGEVRESFRLMC